MLRAWRLLSAQPSLQRLPRRIGGGPAAVRFLTVSDPGPVRKLDDSSEDNPSAEELGKKRTLMLGRLLKAGEAHKAREMFQALLEDGHAVEHHVTTMLKACATSNEHRALVSRAGTAGSSQHCCSARPVVTAALLAASSGWSTSSTAAG